MKIEPFTPMEIEIDKLFEAMDESGLECYGGYPSERCYRIPGFVVVADSEDKSNEHTLAIYHWEDMKKWVKAAKKFAKENPDFDLCACAHETMPKQAEFPKQVNR